MKLALVSILALATERALAGPVQPQGEQLPQTASDPTTVEMTPIPISSEMSSEPTESTYPATKMAGQTVTFHIRATIVNGSTDAGMFSVLPGMGVVQAGGGDENATRFSIDEKGGLYCPAAENNAYFANSPNGTLIGVGPLGGFSNLSVLPCSLNGGSTKPGANGDFSCKVDSSPYPGICEQYWGFSPSRSPVPCRYGVQKAVTLKYIIVDGSS